MDVCVACHIYYQGLAGPCHLPAGVTLHERANPFIFNADNGRVQPTEQFYYLPDHHADGSVVGGVDGLAG
jgi:hypothetical protein